MSNFTITSHKDKTIIFEGNFHSFQECLESAVIQNRPLHNADLRGQNLSNRNLDGAQLSGADFTGSNLSGANLSESVLSQCIFSDTTLINTCLAYSDLQNCQFEGAQFGATDIVGADFSSCLFSGISCFTLNFIDAKKMGGCRYKNTDGQMLSMGKPPVVIMGLRSMPIAFMDHDIKFEAKTEKRLKFNFA